MDDPVRNPYISPSDAGNANLLGRETTLVQHVRTGQIVTFAMIIGLIIMVGILLAVIADGDKAEPDANPILLWIGVGVGCLSIVVSYVLSSFQHRRALATFREQCGSDDVQSADKALTPAVTQFMMNRFSATLTGQAVLEGAAVINAILMVLDHNLLHIAVVAVMIVGMALHTPTGAKQQASIEDGVR